MSRPSTRCSRSAALRRRKRGAPADDVVAVFEEDREHLVQAEGARLSVDECHGVDAERRLHGRVAIELVEEGVGVDRALDLDDEVQALVPVGEVLDVGDALQLLGLHELLDGLDDLLGADVVGQLGDDDAALAWGDVLDAGGGAHAERAVAGGVGIADAVEPDDLAAGGEVGAGHELHQVVEVGGRMIDEVAERLHDLDEVVRGDVGGHADGDAGRTVDQEVGQGGRQHGGLGLPSVVVGPEVDGLLVDRRRHRHGARVHAALGVAHRGRRVVGRAEVAVAVDEWQPHRPRLHETDEGVVDRTVAVRVQAAHDLADHTRALDVPAVGPQVQVVHRVERATLHRLEAVAGVGDRAGVDHRVRVLDVARAHLVRDVGVDDVLVELFHRRCCPACHASSPRQ